MSGNGAENKKLLDVPDAGVHERVSWGNVFHIVTRLLARWSGVQIPVGARDFSVLQNVHTSNGAHSTSYSMGTCVLSQWKVAGV
jgi:hypothetical protein